MGQLANLWNKFWVWFLVREDPMDKYDRESKKAREDWVKRRSISASRGLGAYDIPIPTKVYWSEEQWRGKWEETLIKYGYDLPDHEPPAKSLIFTLEDTPLTFDELADRGEMLKEVKAQNDPPKPLDEILKEIGIKHE